MSTDRPLMGVQIEDNKVDRMAELARTLRPQITMAPLEWGSIEKRARSWDWRKANQWRRLRDELGWLPRLCWKVYPVHMNSRGNLPRDLRSAPLDSSEMIDRFDAFCARAAEGAGWRVEPPIVILGNEVDWFAGANPQEFEAAVSFLREAADAVRRHAPEAKVVHTCQVSALDDPGGREVVETLNESTDLAAFTWYDMAGDFGVDEVSDVDAVLARMQEAAGGKPVLVAELGMPTRTRGASEEKQALFLERTFDALAGRTRDEVEGVVYEAVDDWPSLFFKLYAWWQFPELRGNREFHTFLTSFGLRRSAEEPKRAFSTWLERMDEYARV